MKRSIKALLVAAATSVAAISAHASEGKKIVLQISDDSPEKQTLVLNVANNLEKLYGQGKSQIEIVAFGPGLKLLLKDNSNAERIQGLSMEGVQFSACGNTIKGMTKKTGHAPVLNPNAKVVDAGIGRIVELTEQGYTLVRP